MAASRYNGTASGDNKCGHKAFFSSDITYGGTRDNLCYNIGSSTQHCGIGIIHWLYKQVSRLNMVIRQESLNAHG